MSYFYIFSKSNKQKAHLHYFDVIVYLGPACEILKWRQHLAFNSGVPHGRPH